MPRAAGAHELPTVFASSSRFAFDGFPRKEQEVINRKAIAAGQPPRQPGSAASRSCAFGSARRQRALPSILASLPGGFNLYLQPHCCALLRGPAEQSQSLCMSFRWSRAPRRWVVSDFSKSGWAHTTQTCWPRTVSRSTGCGGFRHYAGSSTYDGSTGRSHKCDRDDHSGTRTVIGGA